MIDISAAREDVYGVCVGGVLGHALCTGLAVLGGRIIATRISVRTVTLVSYFQNSIQSEGLEVICIIIVGFLFRCLQYYYYYLIT